MDTRVLYEYVNITMDSRVLFEYIKCDHGYKNKQKKKESPTKQISIVLIWKYYHVYKSILTIWLF